MDALTSKQAMLMYSLAKKFEKYGHQTLITCRDYEYTASLLERYGAKFISIGKYGGKSLYAKLFYDNKRMLKLMKIIKDYDPDVLISYPSPSGCRVAFGLKIPIVLLTDTPHAEAVHRLTVPLSNYLVFSKCIPSDLMEKYVLKSFTKIIQYNGIDELEWITEYIDKEEASSKRENIEIKEPYIIFRPEESKAAYYRKKKLTFVKILKLLNRVFNGSILFLPRYREQAKIVKKFRNVIIPNKAVDLRMLYREALLVITGGATIAREAALVGTPSISYFPLEVHVNTCVTSWGFPLYSAKNIQELKNLIVKILNKEVQVKKDRFKKILFELEKPSTILIDILREI